MLGVELALLEPQARRADRAAATADRPIPGAAIELFVIALIFTLVLLAMSDRRRPRSRSASACRTAGAAAPARLAEAVRGDAPRFAAVPREPAAAGADRSRAAQVADAVAASQRRELAAAGGANAAGAASDGQPSRRIGQHMPARDAPAAAAAVPIGQSYRRRTRGRISASAGRRDRDVMNKQSREALDAYYVEAGSWAQDRQEELRSRAGPPGRSP